MTLFTTAIGAFPKPSYVEIPDWFSIDTSIEPGATIATSRLVISPELEAGADRAVHEVVRAQPGAGVDIPTDGEIRRENYVHYHCRHLNGIDFSRLTQKVVRNGTWTAQLPTFVGAISPRRNFLDRDYESLKRRHPDRSRSQCQGR